MHAKLAGGPALISFVLLQNRKNEPLLEFSHCLGVKNIAFVHLHDEGF